MCLKETIISPTMNVLKKKKKNVQKCANATVAFFDETSSRERASLDFLIYLSLPTKYLISTYTLDNVFSRILVLVLIVEVFYPS